jgi:hypothetical protein
MVPSAGRRPPLSRKRIRSAVRQAASVGSSGGRMLLGFCSAAGTADCFPSPGAPRIYRSHQSSSRETPPVTWLPSSRRPPCKRCSTSSTIGLSSRPRRGGCDDRHPRRPGHSVCLPERASERGAAAAPSVVPGLAGRSTTRRGCSSRPALTASPVAAPGRPPGAADRDRPTARGGKGVRA